MTEREPWILASILQKLSYMTKGKSSKAFGIIPFGKVDDSGARGEGLGFDRWFSALAGHLNHPGKLKNKNLRMDKPHSGISGQACALVFVCLFV